MKRLKVRVEITARNVVNTDAIRGTLASVADQALYSRGKAWVTKNVYNYLINDFVSSREVHPLRTERDLFRAFGGESKVPNWAKEAYIREEPLYAIVPLNTFWHRLYHIVDFLNIQDRDWSRISFPQMKKLVEDWDEELKKQKTEKVLKTSFEFTLNSGPYQWVRILDAEGLEDEGAKMQHCCGGPGYARGLEEGRIAIYSLRDKNFDNPHVTIEVNLRSKEIRQIQGKQNTANPKYQKNVADFLNHTKYEVENDELLRWGLIEYNNRLTAIDDLPKIITFDNVAISLDLYPAFNPKSSSFIPPEILDGRIVNFPKAHRVYTRCSPVEKGVSLNAPKAELTLQVEAGGDAQEAISKVNSAALRLVTNRTGTIKLPSDLTKFASVTLGTGNWSIPADLKVNSISTLSTPVRRRLEEIGILKPSVQYTNEFDITKITSPLIKNLIDIKRQSGERAALKEISRITGERGLSGSYIYSNFEWYFTLIKKAFPPGKIKLDKPLPTNVVGEVRNILRFIQSLFSPVSKTAKSIDYILSGRIEAMVNPRMAGVEGNTWFLWSSQLSR